MAPTAVELRAAASSLRSTATLLDLTVAPLVARAGPETWEGPAADAFLGAARGAVDRAAGVGAGLRAVAARLDRRADEVHAGGDGHG